MVHELPEAERCCPHDGRPLKVIGEVASEQLDIVPATIQVLRHVRVQYACNCGQCIRTAPLPPQPIPKSNASPGLLAHVVVAKYQDALLAHDGRNLWVLRPGEQQHRLLDVAEPEIRIEPAPRRRRAPATHAARTRVVGGKTQLNRAEFFDRPCQVAGAAFEVLEKLVAPFLPSA